MTWRRALAVLVALAGLLGLPAAAPASAATGTGPVVVVGIPGLRWSDVSPGSMPVLWALAGRGSAGSLSVRSAADQSCPADGWVMLGAGDRAAAPADRGGCPDPGAGPAGGTIPAWSAVLDRNAELDVAAHPGALADALRAAGQCVAAAGPGAGLGAATRAGRVAAYDAAVTGPALRALAVRCPVLLVGGPVVRRPADPAVLTAADRTVAAGAAAAGPRGTVLVAGLSDTGDAAHLHVAVAAGPSFGGRDLRSASTRRAPYVQVVDIAPTVLALRGVAVPAAMTGAAWRATGQRAAGAAATVDRLDDADSAAQAVRGALPWFLGLLIGLQLLGYGAARLVRARGARLLRGTALVGMAGPVGSYLAQLSHWWRAPVPVAVLTAVSAGCAVAVAAFAVAVTRGRRAAPVLAAGVVAGVTAAVLAVDVASGSHLQLDSVFGYSPIVAGRFAGFGNVAFGVFGTAALLAAGTLALGSAAAGRWRAAAAAGAVGILAVVADGAPPYGSDFGGALALVPAVGILVLALAGRRLSWRLLAGLGGLAVAVVAGFALIDYARPPDARTHLGRFAGQVLHGGAWPVVRRKARANIELLTTNPVNLLVPVATAYLVYLAARPRGGLAEAQRQWPQVRSTLLAVAVMAVVGFVANDSGDAVPAMAMLLAIPYAVLAAAAAAAGAGDPADTPPAASRPAADQGPAVLP